MCSDVRSQETCAKEIGQAPLAHPFSDVRLAKNMSMNSRTKTLSGNPINRSIFPFMYIQFDGIK